MKKKICVITGSRAEYGLLRKSMLAIKKDSSFQLQIVVTGMHLLPEYGLSVTEIEEDGFLEIVRVDSLGQDNSPKGISDSVGKGVLGCGKVFAELKPDLVLLLGDRFEILAAAVAAFLARIPIAHLHGGEVTHGSIDDSMRHAITKLSNYHFVANKEFADRVIQLGESRENVFIVGGLGVDGISDLPLLTREQLEEELGLTFLKEILLVTFHPATAERENPRIQMLELLEAISDLKDTSIIFTLPNSDSGSKEIASLIKSFVSGKPSAAYFESLGHLRYLSLMACSSAVVGNSSSGIAEAPTLGVPTVDIGSRQAGRPKASSVISCDPFANEIKNAVSIALSHSFRNLARVTVSPYGVAGASTRIVEIIRTIDLHSTPIKIFNTLNLSND